MGGADRGEGAFDAGRGKGSFAGSRGEVGDVSGNGLWGGLQRDVSGGGAPSGELVPVPGVGAAGGGGDSGFDGGARVGGEGVVDLGVAEQGADRGWLGCERGQRGLPEARF
ncbi:hypothetical protein GCM10010149_68540 [Nonomuraea roseoviolacea subsp. roseoviolacea]